MMLEAAVLLATDDTLMPWWGTGPQVTYWHLPADRTSVYLPDRQEFWEAMWANRRASGLIVAHSHPGSGTPGPSLEDLTTFEAVEAGLGRPVTWLITSRNVVCWVKRGPSGEFVVESLDLCPTQLPWLRELRSRSYKENRS
jgi:hypothetical protein